MPLFESIFKTKITFYKSRTGFQHISNKFNHVTCNMVNADCIIYSDSCTNMLLPTKFIARVLNDRFKNTSINIIVLVPPQVDGGAASKRIYMSAFLSTWVGTI